MMRRKETPDNNLETEKKSKKMKRGRDDSDSSFWGTVSSFFVDTINSIFNPDMSSSSQTKHQHDFREENSGFSNVLDSSNHIDMKPSFNNDERFESSFLCFFFF